MKPENLKTKIFLDSGDPDETKELLELMGDFEGQTTNPSLFAKNPAVKARIDAGDKYSKEEVYEAYKDIVVQISELLPNGSVSVEVYADHNTSVEEVLSQAREMNSWIPNAHIKLPLTTNCLEAAGVLIKEGVRLNITLVFSQQQAAAIYTATKGATKGQVYLSPFIGRLDDRGEDGMSYIANVLQMYKAGDGHVEVLSASVRNYDHLLECFKLQSDIATVPGKILREWVEKDFYTPDETWQYNRGDLKQLPYEEIDLNKDWQEYDIQHDLTDSGIEKFVADWDGLVA